MCAFIPSTVRQLLRSQTDRQHLISEARLKLKQSSLWGRASGHESSNYKLRFFLMRPLKRNEERKMEMGRERDAHRHGPEIHRENLEEA